ncbi:MAG: hypothetical protein MZU97_07890 [Bacillus subtilis]|nr:hypothetical protein [Bacillus subtilis]
MEERGRQPRPRPPQVRRLPDLPPGQRRGRPPDGDHPRHAGPGVDTLSAPPHDPVRGLRLDPPALMPPPHGPGLRTATSSPSATARPAVDEFRTKGYVKEALINYVAMLGCSLRGRPGPLSPLRTCRGSSGSRGLNKAPAVFDYVKLEWFNGQYIRAKDDGELAGLLLPFAVEAGLLARPGAEPDADQERTFRDGGSSCEGTARLPERSLRQARVPLLRTAPWPRWRSSSPRNWTLLRAAELLGTAAELLRSCDLSDIPAGEEALRAEAAELGCKLGDLMTACGSL